jgi:hypothetical protein
MEQKFLEIDQRWQVPYTPNSKLGQARARGHELEHAWHAAQELLQRRQDELDAYQAELDAITADTDPAGLVEPLTRLQAWRAVVQKCERRVSQTHTAMANYEQSSLLASKCARVTRELARLLDPDAAMNMSPNAREAAVQRNLDALQTLTGIRPGREVFQ